MAVMSFSVSAPGTVMLFGEHAVLRGKTALCAATDQRLQVWLVPRDDDTIRIESGLGCAQTTIHDMTLNAPFQFVFAVLKHCSLERGVDLRIESAFKHTVGLGSSAAVTVATLAAIWQWQNRRYDNNQLISQAREIIFQVQGCGSGADVAACVYGGIVAYHRQPMRIQPLPTLFELSLVYSGSKKKTAEVIGLVNAYEKKNPEKYRVLFDAMDAVSCSAMEAITREDRALLARCMKEQQQLLCQLGVSNALLDELIERAITCDEVAAAKISGSGLGDCIMTLGALVQQVFPANKQQRGDGVMQLDVRLAERGLEIE
jgi:mevalonate kinase